MTPPPDRKGRTRLGRLLKIAVYAVDKKKFDVNVLSHMLGVSRRTIFRDIADLSDAGFDIRYDPDEKSFRLFQIDIDR